MHCKSGFTNHFAISIGNNVILARLLDSHGYVNLQNTYNCGIELAIRMVEFVNRVSFGSRA